MRQVYNPYSKTLDAVDGAGCMKGDIIESANFFRSMADKFEVIDYKHTRNYIPIAVLHRTSSATQVCTSNAQAVVINDEIWCISGCDSNNLTTKIRVYNTKTDTWRDVTNVPMAIKDGVAIYDKENSDIYFGLGSNTYDNSSFINRFWKYSIADNVWEEKASCNFYENQCFGGSYIIKDNKIYIFFYNKKGASGYEPQNKVLVYDILSNTWLESIELSSIKSIAFIVPFIDLEDTFLGMGISSNDKVKLYSFKFPNFDEVKEEFNFTDNFSGYGVSDFVCYNGFVFIGNIKDTNNEYNWVMAVDLFKPISERVVFKLTEKQVGCIDSAIKIVGKNLFIIGGSDNSNKVDFIRNIHWLSRILIKK